MLLTKRHPSVRTGVTYVSSLNIPTGEVPESPRPEGVFRRRLVNRATPGGMVAALSNHDCWLQVGLVVIAQGSNHAARGSFVLVLLLRLVRVCEVEGRFALFFHGFASGFGAAELSPSP